MTRREFIATAAAAAAAPPASPGQLRVPVHQVTNTRADLTPEQLRRFSSSIWPEAVRDFGRCGVEIQSSQSSGEIGRSPGARPVFKGLKRGVINLVVTDRIPISWDYGRGLTGLSTRYEGYDLCIIALNYAHAHQIPIVSVNTCVHELLHVLLQDIYISDPTGWRRTQREFRIDWYATRLWLFKDGVVVRQAAQAYLERVRSPTGQSADTRSAGLWPQDPC
jgi:hypothetical protein